MTHHVSDKHHIALSQPFCSRCDAVHNSRWAAPTIAAGLSVFGMTRVVQLALITGILVAEFSLTPVWMVVALAVFVLAITAVQVWSIFVHTRLFKRIRRLQRQRKAVATMEQPACEGVPDNTPAGTDVLVVVDSGAGLGNNSNKAYAGKGEFDKTGNSTLPETALSLSNDPAASVHGV